MTTHADHDIGWLTAAGDPTPGGDPIGPVPPLVATVTKRLRARSRDLATEQGGSLPVQTGLVVVHRVASDVDNYAAERFAYDHPQTRPEVPGRADEGAAAAGYAAAQNAATLATFEGIRSMIDTTDEDLAVTRRDRDERVLSLHMYDAHPNVAALAGLHRSMLAKLIANMVADAKVQPTYMPTTRGEALRVANEALAKKCKLPYHPQAKAELPDLATRVDALSLRRAALTATWRALGILVVQPESGFGVKAPAIAALLDLAPTTVWRAIHGDEADAELRAMTGAKARRKTRAKG